MLRKLIAGGRYIVLIAVIGTFLSSLTLFIYGLITVVLSSIEVFGEGSFTPEVSKHLSIAYIQLMDLFLLGAVLHIVSLGLYRLFVDDKLPLPRWLTFSDIDDLKVKLIGVVSVLLAVSFLGSVVEETSTPLFQLGIAVGAVLLSLSLLLLVTAKIQQWHHQQDR